MEPIATDRPAERVPDRFDPVSYPTLRDLGARLRALAGQAAHTAGREYLTRGQVRHGAIAGTTAHATVVGSTEYRVTVAFAPDLAEPKVTCTCPAHRRNRHCKHVVALVLALLERPHDFALVAAIAPPPAAPRPSRSRRASGEQSGTAKERAAVARAAMQADGLGVVDRLLDALAGGGIPALTGDGGVLLAEAAETVRALKLRRLGNRLMALRRLTPADEARFAALLCDVALIRQTLAAQHAGRITLDPALTEELLGKTWRDADLEPVAGLTLFPLGGDAFDDGEYRVDTSYLLDLAGGGVTLERQIVPSRLRAAPKPPQRFLLHVAEAGLYPGAAPRRIKLRRFERLALTTEHVARVLALAPADLAPLRAALLERLGSPFDPPEVPVLLRPAALGREGETLLALDAAGHALRVVAPASWVTEVARLLPEPGGYALFGVLRPAATASGLEMTAISAIGALAWGRGPHYPAGA